jgi:hypothetical protein
VFGVVGEPERCGLAIIGCGRPGVFGSQPVVHADDRETERIGEVPVADVAAYGRTQVEPPTVDLQEDAGHLAVRRHVNAYRDAAAAGANELHDSGRV